MPSHAHSWTGKLTVITDEICTNIKIWIIRSEDSLGSIHSNNSARDSAREGRRGPLLLVKAKGGSESERESEREGGGPIVVSQRREACCAAAAAVSDVAADDPVPTSQIEGKPHRKSCSQLGHLFLGWGHGFLPIIEKFGCVTKTHHGTLHKCNY